MGPRFLALAAAVALAAVATAGGTRARTEITVWSGSAAPAQFGGVSYGGFTPTAGALVVDHREVEVVNGELRVDGVASVLDPASVQLRDLTEPGIAITEQRFVAGAATPTEMLARHVGEPITVGTAKGELTGTLRSVDENTVAIEANGSFHVLRREILQGIRVTAGGDRPKLAFRAPSAKPGKHALEVSYRTEGLAWSADYVAVLDEAGTTVDFAAWATLRNATGASYDDASLTLVGPTSTRFEVPGPVHVGTDAVQVELIRGKHAAKTRSVVAFEAQTKPDAQTEANVDCQQLAATTTGHAETAVELDVGATLPDGKVRLFRRIKDRVEVVNEDELHALPGLVRLRIAPLAELAGERHATACNYDEPNRTLREKIEVTLSNKGRQALDVVVLDYMWRWTVARVEGESPKGSPAGPGAREYRVRVPANGKETISYTVVYAW